MFLRQLNAMLIVALVASSIAGCASQAPRPSLQRIEIFSAGQGSAFLPYSQGIAKHLSSKGITAVAIETSGSIENIRKLNDSPTSAATVFSATAHEGVTGKGTWTQGAVYSNIRALVPMYETSFQFVAMKSSGISSVAQLNGKKVGVGPAGGPAELYFKALA